MMGPRASYWPFYLKNGDNLALSASYNNKHSILGGRKRYPVREKESPLPNPLSGARPEQTTSLSFLEAVPGEKLIFSGQLRFHNLHEVELGALLWALCLGDGTGGGANYSHALGRGKAFGYGRLTCSINKFEAKQNFMQKRCDDVNNILRFLDKFIGYMDAQLANLSYEFSFTNSPAVKSLLAMADPRLGKTHGEELGYMALKSHQRNKNAATTLVYVGQSAADWVW